MGAEPQTGCVYFLQALGGPSLVKIGRAKNFSGRLSAIRSQSPVPIRVLGVIECANPVALEAEMHRRFRRARVRGEWFKLTAEMLGLINREGEIPGDEWNPTFCQLLNNARRFAGIFANRSA